MAKKLFEMNDNNLFSPLIDVAMGALGGFFILLIVYMVLFREEVLPPPEEIQFIKVNLPPAIRGQNYVFTFPVVGGSGMRQFQLIGNLPDSLLFESNSGTIYGIPKPIMKVESRDFQFLIEVSDLTGRDTVLAYLKVNPTAVPYDPEQTPFNMMQNDYTLEPGRVGRAYREVLGALGGIEPYVWETIAGHLPEGLRLENGYIIGIPQGPGSFEFTVRARHTPGSFSYRDTTYIWQGDIEEKIYNIEIFEKLQQSIVLPVGRVHDSYVGGIIINGNIPGERVVWTRTAPGLQTSKDGWLIFGTPFGSGLYDISYQIWYDSTILAENTNTLTILPERPTPTVGPAIFQTWVGEPVRLLIPYRGLREPVQNIIVDGILPDNLRLSDGFIMGTPAITGLTTVNVTIIDGTGASYQGTVAIRVGERF